MRTVYFVDADLTVIGNYKSGYVPSQHDHLSADGSRTLVFDDDVQPENPVGTVYNLDDNGDVVGHVNEHGLPSFAYLLKDKPTLNIGLQGGVKYECARRLRELADARDDERLAQKRENVTAEALLLVRAERKNGGLTETQKARLDVLEGFALEFDRLRERSNAIEKMDLLKIDVTDDTLWE